MFVIIAHTVFHIRLEWAGVRARVRALHRAAYGKGDQPENSINDFAPTAAKFTDSMALTVDNGGGIFSALPDPAAYAWSFIVLVIMSRDQIQLFITHAMYK